MGDDDSNPRPSKECIPEYLARQLIDDYIDEMDEKHRKIPYNWKDIRWKCRCGCDKFEEKNGLIICLRCGYNYEIESTL